MDAPRAAIEGGESGSPTAVTRASLDCTVLRLKKNGGQTQKHCEAPTHLVADVRVRRRDNVGELVSEFHRAVTFTARESGLAFHARRRRRVVRRRTEPGRAPLSLNSCRDENFEYSFIFFRLYYR